jgi:hypothetical protein
MTNNISAARRGTRQELTEYTTLELVSVLVHAQNSRRQMDRFVERVAAELTQRDKNPEVPVSMSRLLRRWKQRSPALPDVRCRWIT